MWPISTKTDRFENQRDMTLKDDIRKKRDWASPEQETLMNLMRTHSQFACEYDRLFRSYGLSSPQYNILRILRGHAGTPLPSLEIAAQMITIVPDITRLLDRLEKAGYVQRQRSTEDRRVVHVVITAGGKRLLAKLDEPVRRGEVDSLKHMTRKELAELSRLLTKARGHTDQLHPH